VRAVAGVASIEDELISRKFMLMCGVLASQHLKS
jgi:hypothetical protein